MRSDIYCCTLRTDCQDGMAVECYYVGDSRLVELGLLCFQVSPGTLGQIPLDLWPVGTDLHRAMGSRLV